MINETRGAARPGMALSVEIDCAQIGEWDALCASADLRDAPRFAEDVLQNAAIVFFSEQQNSAFLDPKQRLDRLVRKARSCSVSVLLTDDAQMRELNFRFRQLDKPTNVLAFPAPTHAPAPDGSVFLGDIVLGHEILHMEAQQQRKYAHAHLAHLLVHGILHLLGFDHDIDEEAAIMESHERQVLARLGYDDPYQDRESDPHDPRPAPHGTMSQKGPLDGR